MGAAAPAVGLSIGGSLLGAYGSYTEGQDKAAYYNYLVSNSRTEAGLAQKEADTESTLTSTQASQQARMASRRAAEVTGAQTAAEGANGTSGSVTGADVSNDTFNKAKLDQMAIKYNADVQNYRTQQSAKLKEFALNRDAEGNVIAGKAARTAGNLGAFNSILGGARQVAGIYGKESTLAQGSDDEDDTPNAATIFSKDGGIKKLRRVSTGTGNY